MYYNEYGGSGFVEDYTLVYIYDETGAPIGMKYREPSYAGGVYDVFFFEKNLQGDIVSVYNSSGVKLIAYTYDAWGNFTQTYVGGTQAQIFTAQKNPFRYRGYYYDADTGLYYLQSRYYNPQWGRFINVDGQLNGGILGYNLYAYCLNNPISYSDPDGCIPKWLLGTIAIAGGVLLAAMTIMALPAAACYIGGVASMYIGTTAAAVATAATYAVGTAAAITAGAYAADSFYTAQTGETVLLDAMGGNEKLYQAGAIVSSIATVGIYYAASQGYAHGVCFVAGTLVATESGSVPIEEITVGTTVYAHNPDTGETELKAVVNTFVNKTNELVHIKVNGEEIITTPSHPFYVPQKGWTDAIRLRAGDRLQLLNGDYVIIEQVQHELLEAPITVYNFEVADFHTYYVTESAVLVHNECTPHSDPSKFTKMRGNQGYKDKNGFFWNVDKLHKDHYDITDAKGNKVREVNFDGIQIWPNGPKNKNKS